MVEEQARKCAEQTAKVEADQKETEAKVGEAQAALAEVCSLLPLTGCRGSCQPALTSRCVVLCFQLKSRGGVQHGSMWWMQREVTEAEKFLPQSKQKSKLAGK